MGECNKACSTDDATETWMMLKTTLEYIAELANESVQSPRQESTRCSPKGKGDIKNKLDCVFWEDSDTSH